MIRTIVYDFDGVICDSVNIKTEAFAELYKSYGEKIVEEVVSYHLTNGGISRFEKIKYFSNIIIGVEISEEEINKLANRFSELVKKRVIESEYLNGALSFIKTHASSHMQFICTGTPETEIIEILRAKNINSFFTNIYGSPKKKEQILNKIIKEYFVNKDEILFIGDAITDYKAAIETGVLFAGIKNEVTNFPNNTFTIDDFSDPNLRILIEKI